MRKALSQLRGMQSALLPDPQKVNTPAAFNAWVSQVQDHLERIKLPEDVPAEEPPSKTKLKGPHTVNVSGITGTNRMEEGGDVRGDEE